MQSRTFILVSLLAAISAGCSGLGVATTPTLGSQIAQEQGISDIWAGDHEAADVGMELAYGDQDRFHQEDWTGLNEEVDVADRKDNPRVERFMNQFVYFSETPKERAERPGRALQ